MQEQRYCKLAEIWQEKERHKLSLRVLRGREIVEDCFRKIN